MLAYAKKFTKKLLFLHTKKLSFVQDSTARVGELESTNKRVVQELADFKAESKELRNQDLTIKRLEAQLGQMKAQLQNRVSHSFTLPVCALQSTQRIATVWATLAFHFRLILPLSQGQQLDVPAGQHPTHILMHHSMPYGKAATLDFHSTTLKQQAQLTSTEQCISSDSCQACAETQQCREAVSTNSPETITRQKRKYHVHE